MDNKIYHYSIVKDFGDCFYGILKLKKINDIGDYGVDKIQSRINELKQKFTEQGNYDYFMEDIMQVILSEFDNIVEFIDLLEDDIVI